MIQYIIQTKNQVQCLSFMYNLLLNGKEVKKKNNNFVGGTVY